MLENVLSWAICNWIELFGTISGLLYIWFSIRHSIWLWPIGLLTSAAYIIVFYQSKLFADMSLQVYYLIVSIYGWFHWVFGKQKLDKTGELKISKLKPYQWIIAITACVFLTIAYYPLGKYFGASYPIWDGLITGGSIVATWMLTRKIIEQWIFWIIIDGASIGLVIAKERYLTVILMTVYTVMAFVGYMKWKKDFKLQK
jgi:nicotinamide mononucleotide transporter